MKKIFLILLLFNSCLCFSQRKDSILGVVHLETGSDEIIIPSPPEIVPNIGKVYWDVEKQPEYITGEKGLRKFINDNRVKLSKEKYDSLKVENLYLNLKFIVMPDGSLKNIEIRNKSMTADHAIFENDAIKIISLTQNSWKPALIKDKPVPCFYQVLVRYNKNGLIY